MIHLKARKMNFCMILFLISILIFRQFIFRYIILYKRIYFSFFVHKTVQRDKLFPLNPLSYVFLKSFGTDNMRIHS